MITLNKNKYIAGIILTTFLLSLCIKPISIYANSNVSQHLSSSNKNVFTQEPNLVP